MTPWPLLSILGFKIDQLIRDKINDADVLLADITFSNYNVYYEIGFAMGRKKPVVPLVNTSYESYVGRVSVTGLFDIVGYLGYQNSSDLVRQLPKYEIEDFSAPFIAERNYSKPLYVVLPSVKPESINTTIAAIANSFLEVRTYDPEENPKLYAAKAIEDVSSSAGIIIPFMNKTFSQAETHNLKASFILGLAHGLGAEPLVLQFDDETAPLDYREFITTVRSRREIEKEVEDYCQKTLIANQRTSVRRSYGKRSILESINLGASAAENEASLGDYFVETAQYNKAERASGAVVIGRKGSGKTAILTRLIERRARDKRHLIIEMNPNSHNLSELRERLTQVMTAGVYDHTMTAFWQYLIYMEILIKIRELRLPAAKNNLRLLDQIRALEQDFHLDERMVAGDFTSRLD